jgi:type II secretory pathway predicted ATPase ExeA/pSer/pThr/pTyr-binding forkhead associated (FHA) protein
MPINIKWFPEQAFGEPTETQTTVALQTQQNAITYLCSILKDPYGARILLGPPSSGKSTIARQFLSVLRTDMVVARVDGSGLAAEKLLVSILGQFGYHVDLESAEDLLRMVSVFAVQQTRTFQPPMVVVENIENMQPAALRALCLLASLTFQGNYAIRIVLTGSSRAQRLLGSKGMAAMSKRLESGYEVEPLSSHESMLFLHGRLTSCQVTQPEAVLPMSVCDRIHALSGGNPGRLNEIAKGTLEQALLMPATVSDVNKYQHAKKTKHSSTKLIVSLDGEVLETYDVADKKLTIGRSSLADIVIHNEYASKFHALMLLYDDALVLVDLNSSNGTFVNSVNVSSTILRSDDIISLASYRIKVVGAPEADADRVSGATSTDTVKMKTLTDMREKRKTRFPYFDIKRNVGR